MKTPRNPRLARWWGGGGQSSGFCTHWGPVPLCRSCSPYGAGVWSLQSREPAGLPLCQCTDLAACSALPIGSPVRGRLRPVLTSHPIRYTVNPYRRAEAVSVLLEGWRARVIVGGRFTQREESSTIRFPARSYHLYDAATFHRMPVLWNNQDVIIRPFGAPAKGLRRL